MSVSEKLLTAYLLSSTFLIVNSQCNQGPYTRCGYQLPYTQYPQVYNPSYLPYPYTELQQYEPVVNNYNYYNYPVQSYPAVARYSPANSAWNNYPVLSTGASSGTNTDNGRFRIYPTSSIEAYNVPSEDNNFPYANVETEIRDISPTDFKRYFNLEDNSNQIRHVSQGNQLYQPTYTVNIESKQTSFTNTPEIINKHDIQTKTYPFQKTFTIHPDNREKDININLNFVNGVEVTTAHPDEANSDGETTATSITAKNLTAKSVTEGKVATTAQRKTTTTAPETAVPSKTIEGVTTTQPSTTTTDGETAVPSKNTEEVTTTTESSNWFKWRK